MEVIRGTVRGREATIPLWVADSKGVPQPFRAVVDTGFTGYLVLPPSVIRQLGLSSRNERSMVLADGSVQTRRTFQTSVIWRDEQRSVLAYEMGNQPLIGMALLNGSRITIDVSEDGPVTIEPLTA